MKNDLYTKSMLTIIAACLVWLCVSRGVPVVHAQQDSPLETRLEGYLARGGIPVIDSDISEAIRGGGIPVRIVQQSTERVKVWIDNSEAHSVGLVGTAYDQRKGWTFETPVPVRVVER